VPVDPQIKGMLDLLTRFDAPPLSSVGPEQARAGFEQMTTGMRAPEMLTPVAGTEDVSIPTAAGPMKARIYRPLTPAAAPMPTVLFIHGGGFVVGSVDSHDNQARGISAATGSVVVSIDYRLAPEAPWPGPVDDAFAGLRWIADHIAELGGDAAHIAVAGDSAGGNLAAVVAQLAHQEGPAICAQFLIYPVVDFDHDAEYQSRIDNATGYFLTTDDMIWFSSMYVPEGADTKEPTLSPLHAKDLSGLAPAVILTAEYDPLRDEGEAYAAALKDAGVEVHHFRSDGLIHGFFDLGLLSQAAASAVALGCAEFSALLHRD
jgi:acetyl esterase